MMYDILVPQQTKENDDNGRRRKDRRTSGY